MASSTQLAYITGDAISPQSGIFHTTIYSLGVKFASKSAINQEPRVKWGLLG
jgi:hypothetical protein